MTDRRSRFLQQSNAMSIVLVLAVIVAVAILGLRRYGAAKLRKQTALAEFSVLPASEPRCAARSALVVGGNGFLGRRIVHLLLERGGCDVSVLDVTLPRVRDPRVTYFRGDVRVKAHLAEAIKSLQGVKVVFHVASILPGCNIPEHFMRAVNVTGVKNSLEASMEHKVQKFLYTSSATVVLERDGGPVENADEKTPFAKNHVDLYTTTKHEAEDLVMAAHGKQGMHCCILRPGGIYGEGDKVWSDEIRKKSFQYAGEGKVQIDAVFVDSVALGHVLAESKLPGVASGQVYNIGNGKPTVYRVFNGWTTEKVNAWGHPSATSVPMALALFFGWMNELIAATVLIAPMSFFTVSAIRFVNRTWWFNIAKAKRDLGYEPLFGGDLTKTIEWMKANTENKQKEA